jgi:hypothetical protein
MTTKTRRKTNGSKQTAGEQVLVTAEFTALAFTIAAKNLLRNSYGWDDDAAEAFGAALWEQASKMMATAIENSGNRPAQAAEAKAAQ